MAARKTIIKDIDLKALNKGKDIKLRYRAIDKGLSLYLDYWDGGKKKRQYKFLKIILKNTPEQYQNDKERLREAEAQRNAFDTKVIKGDEIELKNKLSETPFIDYVEDIKKQFDNQDNYLNLIAQLKKFKPEGLKLKDINEVNCIKFSEFLQSGHLKDTSAKMIFATFKASINRLRKQKIIKDNPTAFITIKADRPHREYLTIDEVRKIKNAEGRPEIKNAFLFSCFTGLRLSDIVALTFEQIQDGYLHFTQKKTKSQERIKLSSNALAIIEHQRQIKGSGQVFHLPVGVSAVVRKWIKDVGINKHITFHCARHTFATMALSSDIDLYTVSKLLGHSDITTTQIYAKLIDKRKDEAIDKLPEF
ncbi:MAG: tyrosine-type recombinase/integrase [Candidatus Cloacimonetes bacterium]|nr:tyrosine-type recombinase/integrase [Candidatus Cloacimonadota bacterium]